MDSKFKTIIKRRIEKSKDSHGLSVLEYPTGCSKTYTVSQIIVENIMNNLKNKQLYVVPNREVMEATAREIADASDAMLHQLQLRDATNKVMEDAAKEADAVSGGKVKPLLLKSVIDVYKELYENNHKFFSSVIPTSIDRPGKRKTRISEDIERRLKTIKDFAETHNYDYIETLENEIRGLNSELIKAIESAPEFKEEKRSKKECIDIILTSPKYSWVKEIYPLYKAADANVILCTTKKLIMPTSAPFLHESALFECHLLKNAIIYLDECDASKDIFIETILSNAGTKQDIVKIFRIVHDTVKGITDNYETDSEKAAQMLSKFEIKEKYSEEKYKEVESLFIDFYKAMKNIHSELYLDGKLKTSDALAIETAKRRGFICTDGYGRYVASTGATPAVIPGRTKTGTNDIVMPSEYNPDENDDEMLYLPTYISRINEFLKKFLSTLVSKISYASARINNAFPTSDEQKAEFYSVLHEFGPLTDDEKEYIRDAVRYVKTGENQTNEEYDFYKSGFSACDIIDSDEHNYESKIQAYNINHSAETLLSAISANHLVIAFSATAGCRGILKNYNYDYLKKLLGDSIYLDTEENIEALQKEVDEMVLPMEKNNVIVTPEYDSETTVKNIFGIEYADEAKSLLKTDVNGQAYKEEEIASVLYGLKEFIRRKDTVQSMVFYTNAIYNGSNQYEGKLRNLYALLLISMGEVSDSEEAVRRAEEELNFIYSDNASAARFKKVKEDLENGARRIVVTTFASFGKGSNSFKHKISSSFWTEKNKHVLSNIITTRPDTGEKDFDAIFILHPTRVFPSLESNYEIEDYMLVAYKAHELFAVDGVTISNSQLTSVLGGGRISNVYKLVHTYSSAVSVAEQALGRLQRSTIRNNEGFVMITPRLAEFLSKCEYENRILRPETRALYNAAREYETLDAIDALKQEETAQRQNIELIRKDEISQNWINDSLGTFKKFNNGDSDVTTEEMMAATQSWEDARVCSLRNPTPEKQGYKNCPKLYLRQLSGPSVAYYTEKKDSNSIKLAYHAGEYAKGDGTKRKKPGVQVSQDECGLTYMMKVDYIREYFEKNGYATKFTPSEYILTPTAYTNIYKGALGEACVKAYFEHYFGIDLVPLIPEDRHYEYQDFTLKDDPATAVDAKHWNISSKDTQNSDEIEKIYMKSVKAGRADTYIINIFHRSSKKSKPVLFDKGEGCIVHHGLNLYDLVPSNSNPDELVPVLNAQTYEYLKAKIAGKEAA